MDDICYSEFVFLQELAKGSQQFEHFNTNISDQYKHVGLNPTMYVEMAATLLEDMYIRFDTQHLQMLVAKIRGEYGDAERPGQLHDWQWKNPRDSIKSSLTGQSIQRLKITYRGLRRIEELREMLRRDRILEFFGVLLDLRYFRPDLMLALQRSKEIPVTVLYADMDNFGQINKKFGQAAGDVVMKAYLEAVRDGLGEFGKGYRSLGDETVSLIIGQEHERSIELAEAIRSGVEAMKCTYNGKELPRVSASIGVATTPSEGRTADIIDIAEERKRKAKEAGKNRVVSK